MQDKKLRSFKDKVMNRLIGRWAENINPDNISWIAFTAGLACAGAVISGAYRSGLSLWILNRVLDGLDGYVARRYNKQSDRGAYLDIITDFAVYAAIPLAFAWRIDTIMLWRSTALLLGIFYINTASWMYLSILIEKRKKEMDNSVLTSVEMPSGIVEGAETIILYSLFFTLPAYLIWIFLIMSFLTFLTVIQRLFIAFRYLSG